MSTAHLRPYQIIMADKIMNSFKKAQRVMCQMPTGTGKTEVFCEVIRRFLENNKRERILIVVHREELLNQIKSRLRERLGIRAGTIDSLGLQNYHERVIVGMIVSVEKRNLNLRSSLLVIDEAHHSNANTYLNIINTHLESEECKLLGVTATPGRLDGKKLSDIYEILIPSPGLSWFIKKEYLSKIKYYGVKNIDIDNLTISKLTNDFESSSASQLMQSEKIIAETLNAYLEFAKDKKTLIFCVDLNHAQAVKENFENSGIFPKIISSKTNKSERNNIVNSFKNSKSGILINVLIFTEGFDSPDIEVVLLARPTQSVTLYLQMIGRVTRRSKNKEFGIVLDTAGNYKIHGLPTKNYDWYMMFSNPENLSNQDFVKRNKNKLKTKGKNLPNECDLEMYELIDSDSFDCYGEDLNSDLFMNILEHNSINTNNQLGIENIQNYYLPNANCKICQSKIHVFKGINYTAFFDSFIPEFQVHSCNQNKLYSSPSKINTESKPVKLGLNTRISQYLYSIESIKPSKSVLRFMSIDSDLSDAYNEKCPMILNRNDSSKATLLFYNPKGKSIIDIPLDFQSDLLDVFFQDIDVINDKNDDDDSIFKIIEDEFMIDTGFIEVRKSNYTGSTNNTSDKEIVDIKLNEGSISKNNLFEHVDEDTVRIGNQFWMTKNLNLTKFKNGDEISEIISEKDWKECNDRKIPAWCNFENKSDNGEIYGKLYNWHAVNDKRGLAPEGWSLPGKNDWEKLNEYLGGVHKANRLLINSKEWKMETTDENINSLFNGLPGGYRTFDGKFINLGEVAIWWTSTALNHHKVNAYIKSISKFNLIDYKNNIEFISKGNGLSVRCLKSI